MQPLKFHPATIEQASIEEAIRAITAAGYSEEDARAVCADQASWETFLSECGTYQVQVRRDVPNGFGQPMAWLSIKRVDRETMHDWRDLQEIKNVLIGPENEAIELYPAESRRVDSANQYHLFVFLDPEVRLPFGFTTRLVTADAIAGAKQRQFA